MIVTATARRVGHGLEHEIDVAGGHTIGTDEPERLGRRLSAPRRRPCARAREGN
jgi:hypothetical protein